jgi:hypothetical protein
MRNPIQFFSAQSIEVDGEFNFASFGGLKLHVNPNEIAGADNDPISSYTDETGNVDFTATLTTRPTIQLNEINTTHSVISYDGNNDKLVGDTSAIIDQTKKHTIYAVAKAKSVHNGFIFGCTLGTTGDVLRFRSNGGTHAYRWFSGVGGIADFNAAIAHNNWVILTVVVRATSGGNGTITIRENGGNQQTSGSVSRAASQEANISMGAITNGTSDFSFSDVARLLIYEGEHTSTEWNQIEAALNDIYAIY